MGKALTLARAVAGWAEAVEHHAKEMAEKKGIVATGYKLQCKQGKRFIADVAAAFGMAGCRRPNS